MIMRERITLRLMPNTVRKIDKNLEKANARSRNEYVEDAIKYYTEYVNLDNKGELLPQAISSQLDTKINILGDRMSKILFKLAVEMCIMMNVTATVTKFKSSKIEMIREKAVRDVRRSVGRINFEDINKFQNPDNEDD